MVHGIGTHLSIAAHEAHVERSERTGHGHGFQFEGAVEGPERLTFRPEPGRADRRRVAPRTMRRSSELHRKGELRTEEARREDPRPGRDGQGGEGTGSGAEDDQDDQTEREAREGEARAESEGAEDGRGHGGEAGDLGVLRAQLGALLPRPGEPPRELMLYLPSLGRVRARSVEDGISIELAVPLAQLGPLQRARQALHDRLCEAGVRVASVTLRVLPAFVDEEAPAPVGHGLVDVLA